MRNPASYIDHTLLKPTATDDEIRQLCEEAVEYGFAAVCIPPAQVKLAASLVYGTEVAVATVIGFPLGYSTCATKVFETENALLVGATEIDMVINIAAALDNRLDLVEEEIHAIVITATPQAKVKVIIECCYLNDAQIKSLTECVVRSGASFVKTSTGFGPNGASFEDVRLLVATAAGRIAVKAAGGIRNWATCQTMLEAGATRIGTSAGVTIMQEWMDLHR
jgi:deoxyribose-phosphate aldolase